MTNPTSAADAIALLQRTSLPTVITEGSDDYRIMRKIEKRLSDLGVDFMPLGGKDMVLEVWEGLPQSRSASVIAFVDLDAWIYTEIPPEYRGENLIYTCGYSIENDLFIDSDIRNLLEGHEEADFQSDLDAVCADHARQVNQLISGAPYSLSRHIHVVLGEGDKTATLSPDELRTKTVLKENFGQALRGKTLFELLVKQLSRHGRYAKIGHKQLYEFASATIGPIFSDLEMRIRKFLTP